MTSCLKIVQANLARRREAQLSLLNDPSLQDAHLLLISEPYIMMIEDKPVLHSHPAWTLTLPSQIKPEAGRHAFRSLIWCNSRVTTLPVMVLSSDMAAVAVKAGGRWTLVFSVYIPRPQQVTRAALDQELLHSLGLIDDATTRFRNQHGPCDIILAGDFNRHHPLWGGEKTLGSSFGFDGEELVRWMSEKGFSSILPQGLITFEARGSCSTIDLCLVSEGLASRIVDCTIHETEHGSDHQAIVSRIDVPVKIVPHRIRRNFKKTDWESVSKAMNSFHSNPPPQLTTTAELDQTTDLLTRSLSSAIENATPTGSGSGYEKPWWTKELTALRHSYTSLRNHEVSAARKGLPGGRYRVEAHVARVRLRTAIRDAKRTHWASFLEDSDNIWKAARYLDRSRSGFSNVPGLATSQGLATSSEEKSTALLDTFFPLMPPPGEIPHGPYQQPVAWEELSMSEIEAVLWKAGPWKAPGPDKVPNIAWQKTWHLVKEWVLEVFKASLLLGHLPVGWRCAQILPLRKSGKTDYSIPKAFRPISLLATLGKLLEGVLAQRLSFWAEEHGLLPENHFGARPGRSGDQALLLLLDKIHQAWQDNKVLSLVNFDVKGAYNGVPANILCQRLEERRIPMIVVRWVRAFCSSRHATIIVDNMESSRFSLPQLGLPQGSPLSPILYLFFNANLVTCPITDAKGAMGFVDDYTRWVVGQSAEENHARLQEKIIPRTLQWATNSGVRFETDKTSFIHFTRVHSRAQQPFNALKVGTDLVAPSEAVKILGVTLDMQLRWKEHLATVARKGFSASQALQTLRGLPPRSTRHLFAATVLPRVLYAAPAWAAQWIDKGIPGWARQCLNTSIRAGAKAVSRCFRTVSVDTACAEASLPSLEVLLRRRATKLALDILCSAEDHPLRAIARGYIGKPFGRHRSPLHVVVSVIRPGLSGFETISPFCVAPWNCISANNLTITLDKEDAKEQAKRALQESRCVFTDGALKDDRGSMAVSLWDRGTRSWGFSTAIAARDNATPTLLELGALLIAAQAVEITPWCQPGACITLLSDCQEALRAVRRPARQSGQGIIKELYKALHRLTRKGVAIKFQWVPGHAGIQGNEDCHQMATRALTDSSPTQTFNWINWSSKQWHVRNTTQSYLQEQAPNRGVTNRSLRAVDELSPARHVRMLYDKLTSQEALLFSQLRTGHSRLASFLAKIKAVDSDMCECGLGPETRQHFLFSCPRFTHLRGDLIKAMGQSFGELSIALGGWTARRTASGRLLQGEKNRWRPSVSIVKAVLSYARRTGRLQSG